MNQEKTLCLPSGSNFNVWEKEQVYDREIHVDGNHPAAADTNDGTLKNPLKTINAAAFLAKPGTRVWIHGGIYRECVHPARGGSGIDRMISYEAYGDGEVLIKASYQAKHFNKSEGWNLNRFSQGRKNLESDARIWEVKQGYGK